MAEVTIAEAKLLPDLTEVTVVGIVAGFQHRKGIASGAQYGLLLLSAGKDENISVSLHGNLYTNAVSFVAEGIALEVNGNMSTHKRFGVRTIIATSIRTVGE